MALTNYNARPSLGSTIAQIGGRYVRRSIRNYLSNNQNQIQSNLQSMARRAYRGTQRFARTRRTQNLRGSYRNRNVETGSGITGQYDRTRQYRKKNMPRRRKRSWRRWIRRVNAVGEKDLGSRTYLTNDQISVKEENSNKHICLTLALYSSGSADLHLNDLRNISTFENAVDQTQAAGDTTYKSSKFLFQSGILDLTVRNTSGEKITETPPAWTTAGKMEVDVYELIIRRELNDVNGTKENLSQMFAGGFIDTLNIGGAGGGITIDDRGATPWDATSALSYWGVKILKKTKYFLEAGGTFTYQMRDPRRRVSTKAELGNVEGPNREKWTKFVYVIGKLVPGYNIGNGIGAWKQEITVGCTRKYLYKIEGVTEDRDRYATSASSLTNPT